MKSPRAKQQAQPRKKAKARGPPGKVKPGELPLYSIDEIPQYMVEPFILHGWRAFYTTRMCLRSLFKLHNETGNIWTHLIGIPIYVALSIWTCASILDKVFSHYFFFLLYLASGVGIMSCSTIFHLFSAHFEEKTFNRLRKSDYLSVTVHIVASNLPLWYFMFQCYPYHRIVYIAITLLFGLGCAIGPFVDSFYSDAFRVPRIIIFVAMTVSGVFPMINVLYLNSFNPVVAHWFYGCALMLVLYGLGVLIYLVRVPERWLPGRFDYFLHSHQIWHFFVLMASVAHLFTCLGVYHNAEHFARCDTINAA